MRVNAELGARGGWKEFWESIHLRPQLVLGEGTRHPIDGRQTAVQALFSQVGGSMVQGWVGGLPRESMLTPRLFEGLRRLIISRNLFCCVCLY